MPTDVLEKDKTAIKSAFEKQRVRALSLRTEPIKQRKLRLRKLRTWIHENRESIHSAMFADFSKNPQEVDAIELYHVLNEIKHAINHLDEWSAPKKVDAPITMLGTRSSILYEPKGVCLIISPWNYPFSLSVGPLVSAIAAGNTVILKPSEITSNVSALLARMASEVFESDILTVVEGDADVAKALLNLPFDHIFFTGSPAIGKIVMKAAAENLTSVTLELGGKSPTIVTATANLDDAAERIAVSKFVNNGQTCIAPDYIIVDNTVREKLIAKLIHHTKKLFSEGGNFKQSASYCRISSNKHFNRLNEILHDAISKGAKIEFGGDADAATRFFHPIILSNIATDSKIFDEEIFGPILPVVSYNNLDEAIQIINSKPKALALYIYSTSSAEKDRVLRETSSGGVCINDSGIHFLHHNLPFGGVNNSGIGKSHGHYGFLAFSNEKPVLRQKSGFTTVKMFYPPYTSASKKIMDWFLKFF